MIRIALLLSLVLAMTTPALAQEWRGHLEDSKTEFPVPPDRAKLHAYSKCLVARHEKEAREFVGEWIKDNWSSLKVLITSSCKKAVPSRFNIDVNYLRGAVAEVLYGNDVRSGLKIEEKNSDTSPVAHGNYVADSLAIARCARRASPEDADRFLHSSPDTEEVELGALSPIFAKCGLNEAHVPRDGLWLRGMLAVASYLDLHGKFYPKGAANA